MSRFGPISERELDIAECTFRRCLEAILAVCDTPQEIVILMSALLSDENTRNNLKERLEKET